MPRRGRIEIMSQMIEEAVEGVPKTRIMFRNNLSFTTFNYYMKYLLDKGLIHKVSSEKDTVLYKATKKGEEFLEVVKKLKNYIDLVEL